MQTIKNKEIGVTFNYLKLLKISGKDKNGKKLGIFKCTLCGNEKEMRITEVRNGYSKSCGCLSKLKSKERLKKHGLTGTKVHSDWKAMRQRCTNPNYSSFHRYGGRGITYADEWEDFSQFYKDMGEPPSSKHQLDRIDNNGNYCKENCRWVLPQENCNNRSVYKNKTGYTGVSENTSKAGRYSSYFCVNRKHIQVGTFSTPEEAYKARIEAIKKYNKENNTNLKYIEFEECHKTKI